MIKVKITKKQIEEGLKSGKLLYPTNKSSIPRLERGDQNISLRYLHKVANFLGVKVEIVIK